MQPLSAWRSLSLLSKPLVSAMNRGAVLNGFVIGNKAPIVSTIASMKISIGRLQLLPSKVMMVSSQLAERARSDEMSASSSDYLHNPAQRRAS